MRLKEALQHARLRLNRSHIEDASLESELLLRHVLKMSQVQLYLNLDEELTEPQDEAFRQSVQRRIKDEPTAYISGYREFFGMDFYVNRNVLIPRPETELLVEKALNLAHTRNIKTIADIGTGCGAIAVSLALHLPQIEIYATDISRAALEVAQTNCQRHGVESRIHLLEGDLLEPLPELVDLIIANLPYVKTGEIAATFEPRLALDGGEDGLAQIRRLSRQVPGKLAPKGCLLLEIGQGQSQAVSDLLQPLFPSARIEVTPDLADIERLVSLDTRPVLSLTRVSP